MATLARFPTQQHNITAESRTHSTHKTEEGSGKKGKKKLKYSIRNETLQQKEENITYVFSLK